MSNKSENFNLLEERWIPVLMTDGEIRTILTARGLSC